VNISNVLSEYILVFIVLIFGIVFGYRYLVKNNLKIRRKHDEFVLSIPLIGKMNSQGLTARFSRSLATLYESGTPMTESLEQCAYAMNNTVYEELVHDINDSVSQGDRLGEAMRSTGGFSDLSNSMVEIGEETGQLHTMLNRVADTYETELDDTVETLTTLIEPFMIIFLAVMVGIVVIAIYLPIFSLGSAI
jgi:type IV pilus assembly protein PilC